MENPEDEWVDVQLCCLGPLRPEQAPAILNAAARTVRELSARQDGPECVFTDEARLRALARYCAAHGMPYECYDVCFTVFLEYTAQSWGALRSGKEPHEDIFCDVRILPSFLARVGEILCLFYDGSVSAVCRQALITRRIRERGGLETILVPI